jgi:hypothetical protein
MNTFVPRFSILPDEQKKIWKKLQPSIGLGFTLYGGTAIALQLGHRCSVDFDFFSHLPIDEEKGKMILEAMPFLHAAQLTQHMLNTRSYITDDGVKLSFFGDIRLGRIGAPLVSADGVLQVASLNDLMALKLAVILQRVEAKDYKDVAAMLRNDISLEYGLGGASALYGSQFPPSESVKALTYFQGGDLDQLQALDRETLLSAVKHIHINDLPKVAIVSKNLCE